ncbi:hypothetical protein NDU88_003825 [Pleurodeles waltl]|uniref:Uncharacterized protein n=1 Tax=Pleurodeles waltl TaxID=8319 RepID=A0AAV7LGB7_PLEWA|nr:hypothetical protein NDU88_003825 [Pleurodeles waltl]
MRGVLPPQRSLAGGGGGRPPATSPLCRPSSRYRRGAQKECRGPGSTQARARRPQPQIKGRAPRQAKTPGSGAGTPEARPREETRPNVPAAASQREMVASPQQGGHGKASGLSVRSRGVTLTAVRPPKLQVAPAGCGQAGSRGAHGAAPQPTGPPPGHVAVRAHQPRPPRRSHGEAERGHLVAAHTSRLPRAGRLTDRERAASPPGPGRQACLAPSGPLDVYGAICGYFCFLGGRPRLEGGSLTTLVPARDQDNRQEGGPRAELFAQAMRQLGA